MPFASESELRLRRPRGNQAHPSATNSSTHGPVDPAWERALHDATFDTEETEESETEEACPEELEEALQRNDHFDFLAVTREVVPRMATRIAESLFNRYHHAAAAFQDVEAVYQVDWDANYGSYRLANPTAGNLVSYGAPVQWVDSRWSLVFASGGRHGTGFRNLWRRYRGASIPLDRVHGMPIARARELRVLLFDGADCAEASLAVARRMVKSTTASDLARVDKVLQIFWGRARTADRQNFLKLVERTQ
ncbi:hypothetical protein QCE62_08410 [Caballeronia sp. LZ033]|uniref:hypothetical protein n=1 Tax=Caballeronia sp. LZ033 TaxID=3038566 RepID=UPI002861D9A1|nr:hypothetical protein [Caballeronia sp. LZ033]MDR5813612.1 hypothetical protein [Caballeronia sp. LZ033]